MTKRSVAVALGLVLALGVSGCSRRQRVAQPRIPDPTEADDRMVAACQFLGTIGGKSSWGGTMGANAGVERARREAIKRAANKGATHYVRGESSTGGWGSKADVRAYRCPAAAQ